MPSPSKFALFTGLLATAGIFVAGAYASSYLVEPATEAQLDFSNEYYMPSLAPGGNDAPKLLLTESSEKSEQVRITNPRKAAEKPVIEPSKTPSQISQVTPKNTPPSTPATKGLHVKVTDIRADKGTIYVLVFDNAAAYQAYDYTQAVGYKEFPANAGEYQIQFNDLTKGPYAVTLFHDADGNQNLTLDSQGYPVEGYGTSNAKSAYDDLSFDEAVIEPGKIDVKMHYLQ